MVLNFLLPHLWKVRNIGLRDTAASIDSIFPCLESHLSGPLYHPQQTHVSIAPFIVLIYVSGFYFSAVGVEIGVQSLGVVGEQLLPLQSLLVFRL